MDAPASISSPEVLLGAIARGSHAALKRLYEQEFRRLYGIALRIVRRPEIAADVLQETFVQVWQNARTFVPEKGSAVGWLTGITRFRALDAVRKSGRETLTDDPGLGDVAVEPDILSGTPRENPIRSASPLPAATGLKASGAASCLPLSMATRTPRSPSGSQQRSAASRAGCAGG